MKSLIDGQPGATLSIDDRGLHYGDGFFETMRVRSGGVPLWQYHHARIARSCERLRIAIPDQRLIRDEIAGLCADGGEAIVKLIVTRRGGERGYRATSEEATRVLLRYPFVSLPKSYYAHGVALTRCEHAIGINPGLAGLKHLNRLDQVLARSEWSDARYYDGIVQDIEGHVVGTTSANLFFAAKDGSLATPMVDRSGVGGVCRDYLLAAAVTRGVEIAQRRVSFAEILQADQIIITNAVRGALPVAGIGDIGFRIGELHGLANACLNELGLGVII